MNSRDYFKRNGTNISFCITCLFSTGNLNFFIIIKFVAILIMNVSLLRKIIFFTVWSFD